MNIYCTGKGSQPTTDISIKKERVPIVADTFFFYAYEACYSPNKAASPLSTPENPMNAMASKPAVTNAIDIPCIPLGMLTILNCSRMPAKQSRQARSPAR